MVADTSSLSVRPSARRSTWLTGLSRFSPHLWRRHVVGLFAALALGILITLPVLAPLLALPDPNELHLERMLMAPSLDHPLGTDHLGRDLLSRLVHGGRSSMSLSLIATAFIVGLGVLVGGFAGYVGGRVDLMLSMLISAVLAVPSLLLTLAILGVLGTSETALVVALVGGGWVGHARIFRAEVLTIRERLFIESAVAAGASQQRVLVRHVLPHLLPTMLVLATLDLGGLLLVVTSLNFLGLGVQPPAPDWGAMMNEARPYLGQAPWLIAFPGACIALVALSSNLLGDSLREWTSRV